MPNSAGVRDLSGEWLDRATGLKNAHIKGIHLRLPGYGEGGPTLEIFQYDPAKSSGINGSTVLATHTWLLKWMMWTKLL